MKNYILTTQNLTKTYGKKDAAKDINIHVREGEIYGLIGRNGVSLRDSKNIVPIKNFALELVQKI